jgi:hypothetical protein
MAVALTSITGAPGSATLLTSEDLAPRIALPESLTSTPSGTKIVIAPHVVHASIVVTCGVLLERIHRERC